MLAGGTDVRIEQEDTKGVPISANLHDDLRLRIPKTGTMLVFKMSGKASHDSPGSQRTSHHSSDVVDRYNRQVRSV